MENAPIDILSVINNEKPEGAKERPGFLRIAGTLLSVLSGNARPKQDPKYVNLYREVSNASFYSPPLEYFRRPVTRTNKQGETKNYNGVWIETDRGAYTLVQIGALAYENKKFVRERVFALVFSDDPDFLAKAFYGTDEERASITREDFEKYCEVIETRLQHEIERGHKTDQSGQTFYEMGWVLSAIEQDAEDIKTGKKNFFRYKGSSLKSGDTIQRSGSVVTWRERVKNKAYEAYNVYVYANPEFGKEHMRITEWDMQSKIVRWALRQLSIRVNDKKAPFADDRSKVTMREEFAKAVWAQKRYMHPYTQIKKKTKVGQWMRDKVGVGVVKGLQRLGHILANFNLQQAILATLIGGAIGGGVVLAGVLAGALAGVTAAAGIYTVSTLMSSRFLIVTLAPRVLRAASKGGMKVLSPIIPLVPNKRRDVSALIAKFEPKLRSNDDIGGWTMEHNYLKHAVVVPYEFTADTFPDVSDFSEETRKERPKQKLLNSLALQDGVNFEFVQEGGRLYVEASGANGIRTLFDTNGLVSISEQTHKPFPYSVIDGSVKDLFDGVEKGKKVVFRHVANKPNHIESKAAQHQQTQEEDTMIVSDVSEIPQSFITRYAKSKEQFEAELGCSLKDFDTEEFVDTDFMKPRVRRKTLKAREKESLRQEKAQKKQNVIEQRQENKQAALQARIEHKQARLDARRHVLQMAFEQERIQSRIQARKANGASLLREFGNGAGRYPSARGALGRDGYLSYYL